VLLPADSDQLNSSWFLLGENEMEMIIRNIVKKSPSKRSKKASGRRSSGVISKSIKLAKSASYGLGKLATLVFIGRL
jgi:hypothetical protein